MKSSFLASLLLAVLCLAAPLCARASTTDDARLRADLTQIVQQAYSIDAPGAAVIVVRDGQTLYRGARGLANVELSVSLQPEHRFRIGSVTKQFTAAAILLLAERGQLALSDPITKFLPDYHAQGHVVTIQQLLSHTSGIANYTEQPDWPPTLRTDVSVDQLIGIFQDKPFDFAPGERWKYDNSGYILLGAVIEKVSGQRYADFMRSQIFAPLGMTQTDYENTSAITPGRVAGYAPDGDHWRNADFLSMTQPFAAGALLSTVDDLARWNTAIEHGELLTAASWQRASTSFSLPDGTSTRYGAGWILGRVGPVATLEHGGGINGFNAYVLRAPAAHVYVAVLTNAAPPRTPPQEVAVNLAARVLGVALDAPELALPERRVKEFAGTYRFLGGELVTLARDGHHLYATRGKPARIELIPIGTDLFEERAGHAHYRFGRDKGRVVSLEIEPRILMGERGRRVSAEH
jgi:D-alanyl-D-alanine carboxypeptidase